MMPAAPDPAPTRLEIDLDAVASNWALLAGRHVAPVAAVVKADGYGLGARPVAARLYRAGCRHFFVAQWPEAAELQGLVPGALVAVLGGLEGRAPESLAGESLAAEGAVPVLNTPGEIAAWSGLARRLGRKLPALLHVDTGMNRLGLGAGELAALADDPTPLESFDLRYVMTHLAAAEDPDDPATATQLARFARARARLPPMPASIANSSALFRAGTQSDLARPGAALYGLNPTPAAPNPMRLVLRLSVRVLQVREIAAGEAVGYNGLWRAPAPSRIATVGTGYADGLPRALSHHARAVFDGTPLPLVGRVSMDLMTFDATSRPDLAPGDWLELIGPDNPPDTMAAAAGTIGYEILTGLGPRYSRVYLGA